MTQKSSKAEQTITVNSNGEIINIGTIADIESLIAQNMVQKLKQGGHKQKKLKIVEREEDVEMEEVVEFDSNKLERAKGENKFMYAIKIDDPKAFNQGILLNHLGVFPGAEMFEGIGNLNIFFTHRNHSHSTFHIINRHQSKL